MTTIFVEDHGSIHVGRAWQFSPDILIFSHILNIFKMVAVNMKLESTT